MTLIVTEVSDAGIAMVADSAITFQRTDGSFEQREVEWTKLFQVPSIRAGVSYWGCIGKVTARRFDEWLKERLDKTDKYSDVHTLADYLVAELNAACHHRPLGLNQCVGLHVAGFAEWTDGQQRAYFYHVHNGHGHTEVENHRNPATGVITRVSYRWVAESRKLFERHQDFPKPTSTLQDNLATLAGGYFTQNGDYFIYTQLDAYLNCLFGYVNLVDGCRIPRDLSKIGPRMAVLKLKLETVIQIYRCSTLHRIIGGDVKCLSISPTGLFGN